MVLDFECRAVGVVQLQEMVVLFVVTVTLLSPEQHCGRSNCPVSFTAVVCQVTPGPQWLWISPQSAAESRMEMVLLSHPDVALLHRLHY